MTPEIKERLLKELKTAREIGQQPKLLSQTELILAINRLGDVLAEVLDYL